MSTNRIEGLLPVVVTPFTPDGAVDMESLERVIEHLIQDGANALTMFGIGSEFYKLSDDEKREMTKLLIATTRGRTRTITSITRHATMLAVRDAQWAQEQGVDALMLLPPFFMNPDPVAILEHMKQVVESVDIPVILQYAPGNTGVVITPNTFLQLQQDTGKDIYVKVESNPPGPMVSALVERSEGRIGIFIGNAGQHLFDCLKRGASGVMPGSAFLKLYRTLLEQFRGGHEDKAFSLYNLLVAHLTIVGLSAERFIH